LSRVDDAPSFIFVVLFPSQRAAIRVSKSALFR